MDVLDMIMSLYMHWKQRALKAEEQMAKCKCNKPPVKEKQDGVL